MYIVRMGGLALWLYRLVSLPDDHWKGYEPETIYMMDLSNPWGHQHHF